MFMIALIAVGGAFGAVSRYVIGLAVMSTFGASFQPIATLIVNIAGSAIMGLCYALLSRGLLINDELRALIMLGFLGALTTFSSFSMDAIKLFEKGEFFVGSAYILGSVLLSLLAFIFVMFVTRGYLAGQ